MSAADTIFLGARLTFYVIGFAVTVVAVGTLIDHVAGLVSGDPE